MTPEKLFHELLGLGLNWEVIESRFVRESGTVYLEISETAKLWKLVRVVKKVGCFSAKERPPPSHYDRWRFGLLSALLKINWRLVKHETTSIAI